MISLGLIALFLADFIFQSEKGVQLKNENILKGNLYHALQVLLVYVFTFSLVFIEVRKFTLFYELGISILVLVILHFIIDAFKCYLIKEWKNDDKADFWLFLADQFLHIVWTILILENINYFLSEKTNHLYFIIALFMGVILLGDHIIRKAFKAIKLKNYAKREEEIKGIGSLIGKIERTIIFLMFILGHPEIIIAVIGIKSIARFPELNQNNGEKNNDYFILGNLLSLLIVIIGYVLYYWYFNIK